MGWCPDHWSKEKDCGNGDLVCGWILHGSERRRNANHLVGWKGQQSDTTERRSQDTHFKIGQKKRIAEMGTWFVGGFCTGLRGKEMLTIKLAGRANSLIHLNDDEVKIPTSSLSSWDEPREISCRVQSLESLVFLSRKELT
jgi:hypothetical protein